MEVDTLGSSIGAETDDLEVCYVPRVRAISSVGRAPARQLIAACFSEFDGVAPSGTNAASLSEESADSSRSPRSRFGIVFMQHVAWMLHRFAPFDPFTRITIPKLDGFEVAS